MINKSSVDTAKLALINIKRYSEEKNKECSRVRMSKKTLRHISGRTVIRDSFIDELIDAFASLGWHFFMHSDTEYVMIESVKVDTWAKIASSRITDLLKKNGDVDVEYERLFEVYDNSPLSEDE